MMRILRTIRDMQAYADDVRSSGRTLGFVPTMGFLHAGHASLMHAARAQCDATVVSIFVNPTQFGPNEDFETYPRDFDRDEVVCREAGVDTIFYPEAAEMYPQGAQTWVDVTEVSQNHCGANRPNHFRGVSTIVTKLFLAVKPHAAFFGEKDYQQLAIIRQMTRDLNFDVRVVGVPTVREEDGLAMSSRNKYLAPEERRRALALSQALRSAKSAVEAGETAARVLIDKAEASLKAAGAEIDYVHVVDSATLTPRETVDGPTVMLIAAKLGATRLIDNMELTPRPVAKAGALEC